MCVTLKRGVLSATRGPSCRLLAYPRILLGASHTWVAHSSWALHIQIAVMNIIREEHRDDVRGTLSLTHTQTNTNTHTCTHTFLVICECANTRHPAQKCVYILSCMQNITVHDTHTHTAFSHKHFPSDLYHSLSSSAQTRRERRTHLLWCQTLNYRPIARCASPRHFKYRPASSLGTRMNQSDTVG